MESKGGGSGNSAVVAVTAEVTSKNLHSQSEDLLGESPIWPYQISKKNTWREPDNVLAGTTMHGEREKKTNTNSG